MWELITATWARFTFTFVNFADAFNKSNLQLRNTTSTSKHLPNVWPFLYLILDFFVMCGALYPIITVIKTKRVLEWACDPPFMNQQVFISTGQPGTYN